MTYRTGRHRLLAQHRELQRRYADAVTQWRQVVRIRADEPDGWFALAAAQIRNGQVEEALRSLDHLQKTAWPDRFGDVRSKASRLRNDLPGRPPK